MTRMQLKRFIYIINIILGVVLGSCQDHEEDSAKISPQDLTLNVDVIIPKEIENTWSNSIQWALDNIKKAQQQCPQNVRLNLRFHDEDREDLGTLAFNLTHPQSAADTCHAIIGPYYSSHAQEILTYTRKSNIPVILPICTSVELQRQQAKSTNTWFFTESDITQCDVLFTIMKSYNTKNVNLIYSNDIYGKSFHDWFGFLATEHAIHLQASNMHDYQKGEDLKELFSSWEMQGDNEETSSDEQPIFICLSLSDEEELLDIVKQLQEYKEELKAKEHRSSKLRIICSDGKHQLLLEDKATFDAVTMIANPSSGFTVNYTSRFGAAPLDGEAQMYDALTLIALGAAKCEGSTNLVNRTLNEWMKLAATASSGPSCNWTDQGLATAFKTYATGGECQIVGARGKYVLDQATHTKCLQTCYLHWKSEQGEVLPITYYSTAGTNGSSSTTNIWEWRNKLEQAFDPDLKVNHDLPDCTDHWALLVTPSHLWESYRHQADVFAMYQTLREHGYDDDHIVLISEDNLANSSQNGINQGSMFVEPRGEDVRREAKVDYHFSSLSKEDLEDILLGRSSDKLPSVLHTTATSDVFIYWSGHGNEMDGPLWGDEDTNDTFGSQRIKTIIEQMHREKKYRRMMLAVETCYSGIWGEALTGIPDVLVMTAANAQESSKADVWDEDKQTYLSNGFTRMLLKEIDANPSISLRDLYFKLAKSTVGSHVTIYNEKEYGSVYTNDMSEYLQY